MSNLPKDAERIIYDALVGMGADENIDNLIKKIHRLDIGLPCEDEFIVICSWLGQCALIHKLDQLQVPIVSKNEFQVPDLLAVFTVSGRRVSVLIEVKSCSKNILSFKPDYLQRLINYASLLKLPLLVAWKFHGIWFLFDINHLSKAKINFNISFNSAMTENLLGILAGDFSYTLGKGAGVTFRFIKDKLINITESYEEVMQEWSLIGQDVLFTDYNGNVLQNIDTQIVSLFDIAQLNEVHEQTDTNFNISYLVENVTALFAHMALVRFLHCEDQENKTTNWRRLLMEKSVVSIENLSYVVNAALKQNVVYHVLKQKPKTMPLFIMNE